MALVPPKRRLLQLNQPWFFKGYFSCPQSMFIQRCGTTSPSERNLVDAGVDASRLDFSELRSTQQSKLIRGQHGSVDDRLAKVSKASTERHARQVVRAATICCGRPRQRIVGKCRPWIANPSDRRASTRNCWRIAAAGAASDRMSLYCVSTKQRLSISIRKQATTLDVLRWLATHCHGALVNFQKVLNIPGASANERLSLMDISRNNIQNSLLSRGRYTAGLLHEIRHRCALVQKTQLAVRVLLITRVSKNAAVNQRAMDIANERSYVARRIALFLHRSNIFLKNRIPVIRVCLVEGVDLAPLRNTNIWVRQNKLANRWVQRKTLHSVTNRQHENHR
jgi:hypothetical protein